MPSKHELLLALGLPLFLGCHSPPASAAPQEGTVMLTSAHEEGDGVAVVELFTSEGCSSCPSADAVLAEVAEAHDPRVFPLAFHVDYWNSLGWTDRFSSPAWSDRQRQYAGAFGTNSVYTPQMIVGGVEQFTGSDASRASTSIRHAFESHSATRIVITADSSGMRDLLVHFHTDSAPTGASVNVALVERNLVTHVESGENGGRTLLHDNVVRAFATRRLTDADGTMILNLPPEVDRTHAELFGYVQAAPRQGQRGMPIVAAARTNPPVK
jgi:hypothetical protein